MKRRQFIQLVAASTLTPACSVNATSPELTASQTEGPYYPVTPIPESNNLLLDSQHLGAQLRLSGRVLNSAAVPLVSARVEIWQCDGQGIYQHPAAPDNTRFDSHFSGAGATVTDNNGAYEFTTIVPVPYTGRPPHIHTKVFVNNKERLTSQIYLRDSGGHQRLKIDLEKTDTAYAASFDFVIKT